MTYTNIPRRSTSKPSGGEVLGALILSILVTPMVSLLEGVTISKLWEWFVADTFGIQTIRVVQAIGISLLVSLVTFQMSAVKSDDSKGGIEKVVAATIASMGISLMMLFFGFIVVQFI